MSSTSATDATHSRSSLFDPRAFPAVGVSFALHAVILAGMWLIKVHVIDQTPQMVLETIFSDERVQEEFTQEIETDTEIAETLNVIAGGTVTNAIGGSTGPVVSQQKIETSQSLKEPQIRVNTAAITVPGTHLLGANLGEGVVTGETGRLVEGYGAALGQLTQELVRLMREQKVLVVWLFDESESMKDDQQEIRQKFHKVYEELGIVTKQDEALKKAGEDILLTSIMSFGDKVTEHTAKPTSDVTQIRAAIDKIAVDETGKENMCFAISQAVDKYARTAQRTKRRLVVVMISDESGTDGNYVEEAIDRAKKVKAPVYILGRFAVFGFPYAHQIWKDPKYGLTHWLRIDRGPETPMPECLQYDGLHERWDVNSSGFGPYEQVRICRETGGIFFLLPGQEDNVRGAHVLDKYDLYNMKEYLPDLSARTKYVEERSRSKFRTGLWNVIVLLNPYLDKKLHVREWHYSIDPAEFQKQGKENFDAALYGMAKLNEAAKLLEALKPLREQESSQRWRAHFDLIHAQVLAYRVRLFQFILAIDQRAKEGTKPKNPANNEWNVRRVPQVLEPDPQQIKVTKVDTEELHRQEQTARELFQFVIGQHPNTPWAVRAGDELRVGFGMKFTEDFRDPRYRNLNDIKLPKL